MILKAKPTIEYSLIVNNISPWSPPIERAEKRAIKRTISNISCCFCIFKM